MTFCSRSSSDMVRYRPSYAVPRIFVNVASYRDPECAGTVAHLLALARNPGSITVGAVVQSEPEDNDKMLCPQSWVRVINVRARESRGACWARSLGYRLLDDQEYVLQIDSHMRFAQDWDVRMIAQLDRCSSPKPLLTTYPPAWVPGQDLPHQIIFLVAERFGHDGHLTQRGNIHGSATAPKPSALMSANFLFGRSDWVRDVPYDPHLYFSGEETTLAARLWTHGWDMFGPTEPLIWHRYDRQGRRVHWDDHRDWHMDNSLSMSRMRHLLAGDLAAPEALIDLDRYGMGQTRPLSGYSAWSGIDYVARTIAPHALSGAW